MEIFAIIAFLVLVLGPLLAYGIYTARFGEPRRADKPRKSRKSARPTGSAA